MAERFRHLSSPCWRFGFQLWLWRGDDIPEKFHQFYILSRMSSKWWKGERLANWLILAVLHHIRPNSYWTQYIKPFWDSGLSKCWHNTDITVHTICSQCFGIIKESLILNGQLIVFWFPGANGDLAQDASNTLILVTSFILIKKGIHSSEPLGNSMVSTASTISPSLGTNSRPSGLGICPYRVGALDSNHGCDVLMRTTKKI